MSASSPRPSTTGRRNLLVATGLLCVIAAIGTLVYYAVPLYRLFCQVIGFGGTTQVSVAAPSATALPPVTVRFDANVTPDLPWRFTSPAAVGLRPGEERQVAYTAVNNGREPVLGTTTFNVSPAKAGLYLNEIECLWFIVQLLMPCERKDFPVTFFSDPGISDDPNAADVRSITLFYTFFNKGTEARDSYLRSRDRLARTDGGSP